MHKFKSDIRTLNLMDVAELLTIAGTMISLGWLFVIVLGKLP